MKKNILPSVHSFFINNSRNLWLIILVIGLFISGSRSGSVNEEFGSLNIYEKKSSWAETMLASRANLMKYNEPELKNLDDVSAGPWYILNQKRNDKFDQVVYIGNELSGYGDVWADSDEWSLREDLEDGRIQIVSNGSQVTYLRKKIISPRSKRIFAYLTADRGARLWLNGNEIFAEPELGIRRKYLQKVPLDLHPGENELLLAVIKGKSWVYGFSFSFVNDFVYRIWDNIERDFPVHWDWINQDAGTHIRDWFTQGDQIRIETDMIGKVISDLGGEGTELNCILKNYIREKKSRNDLEWLNLYVQACEKRRALRLRTLLSRFSKIIFTRHHNIGGTHYAYTEAQSDAQRERNFHPGSALCLLELEGIYGSVKTLIDDPNGVIRDPDVSMDARRVLFSWKKSDREDDFHLYDLDLNSGEIRQLTSGLGFADYEGVYLPDGDIIFNSTRCVQTVDCWWTEVSNLYSCSGDGRYLRRLSFDQVHTNFPTVMPDGRVIYTRWEYNDRGHGRVQSLFQMNPDGTRQTEYYGNNSWFPNSILHARGIPGNQKVIAIAGGHHARQSGKLILIDPAKGRQENTGAQLIAPLRETKAENIDAYGQFGEQFQYPYPVTDSTFVVTYDPVDWARQWYGRTLLFGGNYYFQLITHNEHLVNPPILKFKIYYMDINGGRELLTSNGDLSCNQPVPLARRKIPVLSSSVDYRKHSGTYYLHDVYAGKAVEGVDHGTIKKIRVIALDYRAAGIGENVNRGPAAGAIVSTPISIGNGSWDVKIVLGDATVYDDGSACFNVPARTPVYFQALNEKGQVVQTMRSWSTLQPGEYFSCVGCHENKNESPPTNATVTSAMQSGPQELEHFYGPPRGFSFIKEIQPILDKNCISCHRNRSRVKAVMTEATGMKLLPGISDRKEFGKSAMSLLGVLNSEYRAGRKWTDSYLILTNAYVKKSGNPHIMGDWQNELVNWVSPQSIPPIIPVYYKGSARSRLISMLEEGHKGVELTTEELEKLCCWIDLLVPFCGDYRELNTWGDPGMKRFTDWFADDLYSENDPAKRYQYFLDKRYRMEYIEQENIQQLIKSKK